jgi:hypothetical protein
VKATITLCITALQALQCTYAAQTVVFSALNAASAAEAKASKTFIPNIATVAGIQVGFSSMDELERQLGKGKVSIGGHPNGARLWRVKGTPWVIDADAFDYSERGAVVDSFGIGIDPTPAADLPYARRDKNDLAWLGKISLGMDEASLLQILKQSSAPTKIADGWQIKARGYSPLTSIPLNPFQEWTVQFRIKDKFLVHFLLDARSL